MQNSSLQCSSCSLDRPIVVLADDITGAAEIAGIAHSYGLNTKLTTTIGTPIDGCDVLVLATDWRQMTENEAMKESYRASVCYKESLIFKKTDSVLRGHILAECYAMLSALNKSDNPADNYRVLLIPQNPSKGRVVRNGIYYINDKPICETSFSYDPEFPAKSSHVTEILRNNLQDKSLNYNPIIADTQTVQDIQDIVSNLLKSPAIDNENIILAGGSDLFSSILSIYHNSHQQNPSKSDRAEHKDGIAEHKGGITEHMDGRVDKVFIVCGSTQSTDISQTIFSKENNLILTKMPTSVFHGKESPECWLNNLIDLNKKHNLILTIGHKPQGSQQYAIRLRKLMANAVQKLIHYSCNNAKKNISCSYNNADEIISKHTTHLLIIEGGATAYQILQTLNWTEFSINHEYAPGVVELQFNPKTNYNECFSFRIILKPGSYPWGNLFM